MPSFKKFNSSTICVSLVYHPLRSNPSFVTEFSDLLNFLCPAFMNIVIVGDFNIHVDCAKCTLAVDFLDLIDCFSLVQHVKAPTHNQGHTLDLVITGDVPVTDPSVLELGISGHGAVLLDLPMSSPMSCPWHTVTFRNLRSIDPRLFSDSISSVFSLARSEIALGEMVDLYNHTLRDNLDNFAPE